MPPAKKTTAAAAPAPDVPPDAATPAPTTQAPTRTATLRSVATGDVVRLAPDEDNPDPPPQHLIVVEKVKGTEHRDDGALVVALPEARWVPLSALTTD